MGYYDNKHSADSGYICMIVDIEHDKPLKDKGYDRSREINCDGNCEHCGFEVSEDRRRRRADIRWAQDEYGYWYKDIPEGGVE